MTIPNILILSVDHTSFPPANLIKDILCCETLSESVSLTDDVEAYPWHIDNRYYTANVNLCSAKCYNATFPECVQCVEAVIVICDNKKASSLQVADSWLPTEMKLSVKLLVCDKCSTGDALSREKCTYWCLDNDFELIELHPDLTDEQDDVEDDFTETVGVERVIEALHAHMWSNLVLKAKSNCTDSTNHDDKDLSSALQAVTHDLTTFDLNNVDQCSAECDEQKKTPEVLVNNDEWDMLAGLTADTDGDTFEELFTKLSIMKDKAKALDPDDRKSYAERVAMSFYNAVGMADDASSEEDDS